MSRSYRLTPEAQSNLDELCTFIADDNVDAAVRVLEALEHAFEQLAGAPEIGHKREDLTTRSVKFWSVYSYLVVYDPASVPLTVLTVLHGARDVERRLKDLKDTWNSAGERAASNRRPPKRLTRRR